MGNVHQPCVKLLVLVSKREGYFFLNAVSISLFYTIFTAEDDAAVRAWLEGFNRKYIGIFLAIGTFQPYDQSASCGKYLPEFLNFSTVIYIDTTFFNIFQLLVSIHEEKKELL